jgi:hypothetical protein
MNLLNSIYNFNRINSFAKEIIIPSNSWIQLGEKFIQNEDGSSISTNAIGDRFVIGNEFYVKVYHWNGSSWNQLGSDITGTVDDYNFGNSVSMNASGDIIAIGSHRRGVLIYFWNGSNWIQLGTRIVDTEDSVDYVTDDFGRSVSINAVGDKVAIGGETYYGYDAINDIFFNTKTGCAAIYSWNGTAWLKLGSNIFGEGLNDESGWSISINAAGDRVAIGAVYNDGNGTDSGHVRIYSWNGTVWNQLGADIDGEGAGDNSGISVSINAAGDRVAIGAVYNDGNGNNSGHARIYSWSGTAWNQLGADIDGDGTSNYFGSGVSMNGIGDRIAIRAGRNTLPSLGYTKIYYFNI